MNFTSIVYTPVIFALVFVAYRYWRDWLSSRGVESRVYAINFILMAVVCLTGALVGTPLFNSPAGIRWMVIISSFLLTAANASLGYLFVHFTWRRVSPWWGFGPILVFGLAVSCLTIFVPVEPFIEATGGINWGMPLYLSILRFAVYALALLPLCYALFNRTKQAETRDERVRNLFPLMLFLFVFLVTLVDFVVEPLLKAEALFSEQAILFLVFVFLALYAFLMETVLSRGEKNLRSLVDNLMDGVAITDENDRHIYTNSCLAEITGYSGAELLNMTQQDLVARPHGQAKPVPTFQEGTITSKDGAEVPVELSTTMTTWQGKKCPLIIIRDITKRKQIEAENARLSEQTNKAQKMESIGRLAGGVAHDLNNMLTPILGYGELLVDDLDADDNRRESVAEMMKAGFKARDLVRQLLAFSSRQTLEYKAVDLNLTVTNFRKLLQRTVREDIGIEVALSPKIPAVLADVGQIEQVIMNLVVNAADAMPHGGRLTIETKPVMLDEAHAASHKEGEAGTFVLIAISDTGCGMDEDTRERLFEPFFSTKGEQGTGLGLATVYGIVKQHGGNVLVFSKPGEGSTFKIYLPATDKTPPEADKPQVPKEVRRGSETILLVEDDARVRKLTQTILERQNYNLLVAENGIAAMAKLESYGNPVDLLLTDVIMPEMGGRELYLQAAARYPDLKVLFMSGYSGHLADLCTSLDDTPFFIGKPFTVNQLREKIREVLD